MTKIFFVFRRLKINFTCFFYKQYLVKQHQAQAQIWSKIITILRINILNKEKSRWVENSMTATKSIHQWMALLTPSYRHSPIWTTSPPPAPPIFTRKFWFRPSVIFQNSQPHINKAALHYDHAAVKSSESYRVSIKDITTL